MTHAPTHPRGVLQSAPATVAFTVALLPLLAGCTKPPSPHPPAPVVQIMTVAATNVPRSTEFIGQLDSPQTVEVRARVEAFVKEIRFKEGREVEKDALLFILDKQPFEQRLAAANGMLAEATAALNKYHADVARLRPLAEAKAIPQQDLDNAIASVAVGQATVDSAQARVQSARLDLSYCDLLAPISGLIGEKNVAVGSLVGKGEPTLLATLSTLDPIWFYCAISEVDFLHAQRTARAAGREIGDLPVNLILADGTEHPAPGKWVFVDRAVNAKTGTIRARAEFPNPDKLLRPGMFARVRISLHSQEGHLLVPERALAELQGRSFVWVVNSNNQTQLRSVEVAAARVRSHAVILGGLQPGERIVVEGIHKLREGGAVEIRTFEQLSNTATPGVAGNTPPAAKSIQPD